MKNLAFFLGFVFVLNTVAAQTVPSDCTASGNIETTYADDADRLALRHVLANFLPEKDSVEIPEALSDSVLRALIAVYNATSLAARDTVVSMLDIHTFPLPVMTRFYIAADSSLPWMQALENNIFPTGNSTIDNMLTGFNLTVTSYYQLSSYDMAVFQSGDNYNLLALMDAITALPGVQFAEPDGIFGDGNDISAMLFPGYTQLTYSYGWGDCPSGCIHRRYWQFNVYPDCSVEFVTSYGDPVDHVTGFSPLMPVEARAFPNPFSNEMVLEGIDHPGFYVLYDFQGKEVRSGGYQPNVYIGDLGGLPQGIYFLKVQTPNGRFTQKMQKR